MVTREAKISADKWVFLVHRLPRDPSAPRIALWRSLRRLGATMLGDGVVALPQSSRTVEHLEWLAAGIREHGGSSSVWVAKPTTRLDGERLAKALRDAADAEYRQIIRDAGELSIRAAPDARRGLRRLRAELRRIASRDYFAAPSGLRAREHVEQLVERAAVT